MNLPGLEIQQLLENFQQIGVQPPSGTTTSGSFSGVMELDHTSFEYKKCMITVNTILEKIIEKETWDITSHLNSIKL